ncbi:hypothetical protein J1N35_029117 [Gossypium stocksii]|uniref:Uncharacterized protein n=1 Tax=Gossypium stocksii TaxID=47602 RepID=A0A9D3UXP5_9ROSI|nr:hypothetical protein J1N35_029117 [Gossypium stocksii]
MLVALVTLVTGEHRCFSNTLIRERLDRGYANEAWWSLFLRFCLTHLSFLGSYHFPLLLNIGLVGSINGNSSSTPFHFDATWVLDLLNRMCSTSAGLVISYLYELGEDLLNWKESQNAHNQAPKHHL